MADQTLVEGSAVNRLERCAENAIHERIVPGEIEQSLFQEHMGRYEFAAKFVEGKSVLDVACGSGYGAPVICGAGAKTYLGVDISSEALRIATSRFRCSENVTFRAGDACRLDWIEDSTIDVAVSFETIEHLRAPEKFLASLQRVLKPGGILLVSTPNRAVSEPTQGLDWVPLNPFHLREWNLNEFRALLRGFFDIDRVLGQLPYPRWKLMGRRAARHRMLGWVRPVYRVGRGILLRGVPALRGEKGAVPVLSMKRWHIPTYIVCVCRPASGKSRGKTLS